MQRVACLVLLLVLLCVIRVKESVSDSLTLSQLHLHIAVFSPLSSPVSDSLSSSLSLNTASREWPCLETQQRGTTPAARPGTPWPGCPLSRPSTLAGAYSRSLAGRSPIRPWRARRPRPLVAGSAARACSWWSSSRLAGPSARRPAQRAISSESGAPSTRVA